MGMGPQQAAQQLQYESMLIAQNAVNGGGSAPEAVYEMAKSRGYVPTKGKPSVESVTKGQKAASSLSGTGGEADPSDGVAEALKMNNEDFDKWWDRNMEAPSS